MGISAAIVRLSPKGMALPRAGATGGLGMFNSSGC